jgi:formate-dependent nitrite reductase cytochrome c552 subunit
MSDYAALHARMLAAIKSNRCTVYMDGKSRYDDDMVREAADAIAALEAENARLRVALEDISQSQPLWNGGVALHTREYLYGYLEELRMIARATIVQKPRRPFDYPEEKP